MEFKGFSRLFPMKTGHLEEDQGAARSCLRKMKSGIASEKCSQEPPPIDEARSQEPGASAARNPTEHNCLLTKKKPVQKDQASHNALGSSRPNQQPLPRLS